MSKVVKIAAMVVVAAALIVFAAPIAGALGIAAITAGTVAAAGVGLAISAAMAIATTLFVKPPSLSQSMAERLNSSINPTAPRKIIFGRTAAGNDIRFFEEHDLPSTKKDGYSQIVALASHRIHALRSWYVEEQLTWAGSITGKYRAGVRSFCAVLEGTSTNGSAIGSGQYWTSTATFTGCAYAAITFKLDGDVWESGLPSKTTFVVDGCPLYDPRRDSSNGGTGAHRIANQATWSFYDGSVEIGRNPALALATYLTGYRINGKLVWGMGVPSDRIDWDNFRDYANLCEERVALQDGTTVQRYTADGSFSTADSHETIILALTAAMGSCKLTDVGGRYTIIGGFDDTLGPTVDFTADHLVAAPGSPAPYSWIPVPPARETYNIARGRFSDPNNQYQLSDWGAIETDALNDGVPRTMTIDLGLVSRAETCQRIAKQFLLREAKTPGVFSATFGPLAFAATVGSLVTLSLPQEGWNRKLFRVLEQTENHDLLFQMVLREESSEIYAWDREEKPLPASIRPPGYDPSATISPEGMAVTSQTLKGADGYPVSEITVTWTAENSGRVRGVQIESKPSTTSSWTEQAARHAASAGTFTFTSNVPAAVINVRLRYRMDSGVYSAWVVNDVDASSAFIEWDSNVIVGENKPDDRATEGAPEGTYVGSQPAENVVDAITGSDGQIIRTRDISAAVVAAEGLIDELVDTYGSTASAAASADAAAQHEANAASAASNAATAKQQAETANSAAAAAKAAAETARNQAQTAAANAGTALSDSNAAKTAAQTAKADAEAAFANSTSAKNAAVAAQGAAESARNNAQTFASNASNSATAAAGSATTAATKATEAGNSASAASGSAVTAQAGAENAAYLDVAHAWDFANNAVNGFTAIGGSLTGQSNGLLYAQTGGDPQLIRTGLSIAGSRYTRVIVDLTRTVASTSNAADLMMFWATAGHSYAAGYRCSPMAVVNPPLNQRTQLTFDLTSAIGSADWLGSTISALRFDLDSASGGSFLIHSIRVVGPDGLAPSKSATAAATSASGAATSAGAAGTSATAAQTSATNASTKAGEASTSATNAATSESNAKGSENAAKTSQTAAAGSATSAGNSASAAATSASTASTKATEANQSASTATTQATSAATKAGEASASASQAATSETNANASKNAAATSANNAANSANAAGGSATAAAGSANNAQTSASSAGNSASAAAAQAIVAASHATGNLVRKGIFSDGSTGTWSGNVTTITTTITPPDGASRVLRTTNRNSAEGDLIAWPFTTARKLRITGYVLAYGSYLGRIGINAVNAAGTNFWYFVTGSSAGSSSWTTVDGIVTVPADIVGLRAFIVSDGPDNATGHDVRATSIAISDITDADAAAASASAAATSASAAGTSASAAGNSANSATQSANTASTKASEAAGSASSAATSASNAASSSTNAGNSATAANSSNVAATLSAAAQMPSDFQQDGRYWQQGFGGLPSALASITANSTFSFVSNTDVGRSMRVTASGQIDVGNIGMLPLQADRVYRITAKVRQQSGSAFAQLQLYRIGVTTTGGTTANGTVQSTYTFTALNQWVELSGTVPASTTNAMIAAGASSIRCLLRLLAASSTVTVDYAYIRIEDITESTSAAGSANAAANSASQASASQSSAGSSASSAQSSATTAATKAGEASTSASQASTSASNAAGSANTASQQAGLAAQSAANSGSSASAAAGSASTASTKASEASQSANAAQSASVTASSVAQAIMPNTFGDLKNWTWDYSNGTSDWSGDSRVRAFDHSTHGRVMEITNNPTFVPHIASKGRVALVRDHKYRMSVKWCLVGQQNGDVAVNASLFAIGLKPDNNQWNNINFYASIAPGNVGWGWSNFATHVLDIDANTLIDQGCTWVRPLLRLESQGVYYVQSIDFRDVTSEVAAAASAAAASTSYSNALYEATLAAQRASSASGSANTAATQASNASNSANAAAASASSASTSSSAAGSSAASASYSAITASTKAGEASSSASAAAGSASTASSQASAASTSASLAATYSTAGGNLLVNTEIVPDTSGWANNSVGMVATHGRSQPSAEWVLTGEHTLSIVQPNNGSSGYAEWTQVINVKPNQWYDVSGLAAAHRCTVQVYFQWVDGNGSAGAAPSTGQFTPGTGGNKIQDWTNYGYKAQAPANAVRANLILRKFPTLSGQTDSWAWFCRPQVRETYADAPTPARYAPGRAGAVLSNMSASISTTQNTVATANAAIASHETRLQAAETNVSQTMGAVSDLQGRTTAYWQVQAVAGDGRAQMRLVADANGGGGVDIVGDLRVTGNALITGTVNPEALALSRFVKRLGPVSISPSNSTGTLYSSPLGETMGNGSYVLEGTVGFTYSSGRSTTTYNGKPLYTDYANDGGINVLLKKNGNIIASTGWSGNLLTNYGSLAYGSAMTTVFDAPASDTYTGNVTVEVVAFKGSTDTGIVNQGDYYTRTISGSYTNFSFSNLRLKWTFI
ncbi:hypothetical protein A0U87_01985 [Sphingobium sp. MP9-4]|uniref:hypothetical protein n=1 Tax=Sphingobium sp. MP9-4 TaxID=1761936 RepID=UPI0010CA7BA1|nr:hypothetical protein [Sphingobium sp. MP9-4]TKV43182.1 hypothetical protein A0U87_01985 [Sphingobium sp. MP9-4]